MNDRNICAYCGAAKVVASLARYCEARHEAEQEQEQDTA